MIYKTALILQKHDSIQAALLKRPAKVSSAKSDLETRPLKCLAKTPYESVLYRKWPRNPPSKTPC